MANHHQHTFNPALSNSLNASLHLFRCVYLFSRLCVCLSALCCSCHVCGFQTELNAQFVSHMSLHVDKEQWMFSLCCTSCDYVSVDESDIKSHIAAEHSGKRRTRNPTTSHQWCPHDPHLISDAHTTPIVELFELARADTEVADDSVGYFQDCEMIVLFIYLFSP